ncbi:MAG: sigma-70 family RNA polymerase sigma factor [Thermoanaerobaculia bacterium]
MSESIRNSVTHLLLDWGGGDRAALERLTPLIYDELHRKAERHMRSERADHTLQPTALVNEAFLRLVDQKQVGFQNRAHFLAIASRLMRRVLVDHARGRKSQKRRLSAQVSFDEAATPAAEKPADILALEDALKRFAELDERKSRVIECRIFGGMTIEETAEALGISTGTVINDYRAARAWILKELSKDLERSG